MRRWFMTSLDGCPCYSILSEKKRVPPRVVPIRFLKGTAYITRSVKFQSMKHEGMPFDRYECLIRKESSLRPLSQRVEV